MVSIIREEKWFLGFLFIISLLIRAVVFSGYLSQDKRYWQVDSNTYDLVAQGIAEGKGISLPDGKPNFYRLPGYPVFLAFYYKLFGVREHCSYPSTRSTHFACSGQASSNSVDGPLVPSVVEESGRAGEKAVRGELVEPYERIQNNSVDQKNVLWMQVVLASFIPLLIFLLSLSLFPAHVLLAKIAAGYSAVHLGLVLYAGFFMTETLFIFLFLLFAILFFKSFRLCIFERNNESVAWIPGQARDDKVCTFPDNEKLQCIDKKDQHACKSGGQPHVIPGLTRDPGKTNDKKPPNQNLLSFLPEPLTESAEFAQFEAMIDDRAYDSSCLIETEEQRNMQRLLLAGFFLGLASLVRPVGHYLVVLSCTMLLFSYGKWGDKISRSFALFLGWIVPVSFWLVRNYMLLGAIFFHTLPGGHFLYLSAARVAMHVKACSYQDAREQLRMEVHDMITQQEQTVGRPLNEIERCNVHEKLAIKYFMMRPMLTLKFWLTDMMRTTLSLYSAELLFLESGRKGIDYFNKNRSVWSMFKRYLFPEEAPGLLKIIIFAEIFLYLFILIGFVASFICVPVCTWLKVLPFIALFIVIALAGGYARMRLPIEPFLIILSLYFWLSCFTNKKGNVCLNE